MNTTNNIPPYLNLSLEDMDGEIWKDIPEYEGLYQASTCGRIKSLARFGCGSNSTKDIILKQSVNTVNNGRYSRLAVGLSKNGVVKRLAVHRAIALTFLAKKSEKNCVDHIDGNPFNNNLTNIRYVNHKENNNNAITVERRRIAIRESHNKPEYIIKNRLIQPAARMVAQCDLNDNVLNTYISIAEAARSTGSFSTLIWKCCHGKQRQTNGYKWKFV